MVFKCGKSFVIVCPRIFAVRAAVAVLESIVICKRTKLWLLVEKYNLYFYPGRTCQATAPKPLPLNTRPDHFKYWPCRELSLVFMTPGSLLFILSHPYA